jgi:hypothetical protein
MKKSRLRSIIFALALVFIVSVSVFIYLTYAHIGYYSAAVNTKNVSICNQMYVPFYKELCDGTVALRTGNISYCETYQNMDKRYFCYTNIAGETHNSSLCELISTEYIKVQCDYVANASD